MISYLVILMGILLVTPILGWQLGRRQKTVNGKLSPLASGILIGSGVLWFVTAKLARNYTDTDGFGVEVAEWFAHSGKWLVLLGALMLGFGWIAGAGQMPMGAARRIFYFTAIFGMTALVIARTVPVYVFLGEGRRDADGYLRQSELIEVTCGAVALLNYLERYQHRRGLTEREVSRVCGVTAEGSTTAGIVLAAHYFGLTNATARVLTLPELEQAKLPAIVSISTLPTVHHATLLIRLDAERAWFIDPAYGLRDLPRERLQQIWYGRTVLLE